MNAKHSIEKTERPIPVDVGGGGIVEIKARASNLNRHDAVIATNLEIHERALRW